MASRNAYMDTLVDPTKVSVVRNISLIKHHINTGIHEIMYIVSRQLDGIVKSVVQNEVQQVREFTDKQANFN